MAVTHSADCVSVLGNESVRGPVKAFEMKEHMIKE